VLDGPATNALCHQLNNMLFFASPLAGGYATPAAVRAELYHAGQITGHDTAAIEIETAEGPVLRFLGTHCTRELFGPVIEIEGDKGRCTWGITCETTLTYASGRQEVRPASREQARSQVTMDFLRAIETGDASLLGCDLPAGRQTVLALDGAHESSGRIHAIAPEHARRLDPGTPEARTVVEGMDELVLAAAERRCLFSDLPDRPAWAVATERFDLTGYRKFPVRFSDAAEA
jgi:predicted dehydrogenase